MRIKEEKGILRGQNVFFPPLFWLAVCLVTAVLVGCANPERQPASLSTAVSEPVRIQDLVISTGQTVYVPAYAKIFIDARGRTIDLVVTLTIHNTDFQNEIILTSVRYFNAQGELRKEYLPQPMRLSPLATTEFLVENSADDGGMGTNFVVEWVAAQPVYEPIVEAIMIQVASGQGISFTSPGRVIYEISPENQ